MEEPAHEVAEFVEEIGGVDFPVLLDPNGLAYRDYQIDAPEEYAPYPRQFIIDTEGRIQYLAAQYYPDALIDTIDALLAQETP